MESSKELYPKEFRDKISNPNFNYEELIQAELYKKFFCAKCGDRFWSQYMDDLLGKKPLGEDFSILKLPCDHYCHGNCLWDGSAFGTSCPICETRINQTPEIASEKTFEEFCEYINNLNT